MKYLIVLFSILASSSAFAGMQAYQGKGGEKLFIECGSDCYVKFSDVQSKWVDKVIKVKKLERPSGTRYQFEYEEELSSGKRKQTYQIVVDHGFELINGSRVPQVQLFFPEGNKQKPLELDLSRELSGQKMDLAAPYKKSPYTPEVD